MLRRVLTVFCCSLLPLFAQAQTTWRACGGDSTWPPMSYIHPRDNSIQGFSIEVLKAVASTTPRFQLRPWARCLAEVEMLQGNDIVMSVFRTAEREKKFLFSRAYFSLTPAYFYSSKRFPTPPIVQKADLRRYKVCSLHGAAISYTGLNAQEIESGATNYLSLYRKVERGHCDIVVDMEEVFLGFQHLETVPFGQAPYEIRPLPESERFPLHFAVSRSHPQAREIIDQIDKGLVQLHKNGKLKQLQENFQSKR